MKKVIISVVIAVSAGLFLAGCASPGLKEFTAQNGDTIRIIDTGIDTAGGPRMKVVQVLKSDGTVVDSSMASGQGTFQGATHLGMTAPVTAAIAGHYQKAAAGALRPAEYNNTESVQVEGGKSDSYSLSSGGNAQGGSSNSNSVSTGGQGGAGGSVGDTTVSGTNNQSQTNRQTQNLDDSTHTTNNRYNTSTVNNPVSVSAKNGSNASVITGNGNKVEQAGVSGSTKTHIEQ